MAIIAISHLPVKLAPNLGPLSPDFPPALSPGLRIPIPWFSALIPGFILSPGSTLQIRPPPLTHHSPPATIHESQVTNPAVFSPESSVLVLPLSPALYTSKGGAHAHVQAPQRQHNRQAHRDSYSVRTQGRIDSRQVAPCCVAETV